MIKVFKIGGNVVDNTQMLRNFCKDFAAVHEPKILVHGGGVKASAIQTALGQAPVKIEGRRVTDADTLEVVTMVYAGLCSKTVVSLLQAEGCDAIGLSGCDAGVITAVKRAALTMSDGRTVDFGYVGDVDRHSINIERLKFFLDAGLVPVINAINHDGHGQLLNTNADTVASSIAAALKAELICCFEMDGVLEDIDRPDSVIAQINAADFETMKQNGRISEGMIPKIENALKALREGAGRVVIKNAARIQDDSGTRILL